MKKRITSFAFFILIVLAATAQQSKNLGQPSSLALLKERGGNSDCLKDSTLIFDYVMPENPDEIEERALFTYAPNTAVRRRFRVDNQGALPYFGSDSTVFNADHQPVLTETKTSFPDPSTGQPAEYVSQRVVYSPCPDAGNCKADSVEVFVSDIPFFPLKPSFKEVNLYDDLGRLTTFILYSRSADETTFVASSKEEYAYDPTTGQIKRISKFVKSDGGVWLPSTLQDYSYTSGGQLLSIVENDIATNEPLQRYVFSNNASLGYRQTDFSYWNFSEGKWNAPFTITREYDDEFGRIVAKVLRVESFSFSGVDSTRYEYAPNTDCLHRVKQYSALGNNQPGLYREEVHFYGKSVSSNTPADLQVDIYPNPANDWLTVEGAEGGTVRIVDARGIVVYQQLSRSSQEVVPVQQLPSGIYWVSVIQQGRWAARRVYISR